MKRASEQPTGFWTSRPPSLDALIARLEGLSLKPEFRLQREVAFARALKPYLEGGPGRLVVPLEQETELASLYLFCDFYPDDGQFTLVEQLRDVITEHIPDEERQWLDPLKHSYVDLLELLGTPKTEGDLTLRSIGDGSTFVAPGGAFLTGVAAGQVLLTRLIRVPEAGRSDQAVWGGCGIALSAGDAKSVLEMTAEWRREMEMTSGSFSLGEWKEFAKRFGYMVHWAFAQRRLTALMDAVAHIRFQQPDGEPYLYVIALYDHHEYQFFVEALSGLNEWEPASVEPLREPASGEPRPPGAVPGARRWTQRERRGDKAMIVAKLTLTSCQLIVECDGPERLDHIKHRLAASLGFSLHFRGETLTPPARQLSVDELMSGEPPALVITPEEDRALLSQFLDKAYLEWSDQPHLALGGQTPRHAAATPTLRGKVGDLIDDMERHDPGYPRFGKPAFMYNRLRAHVGLEELPE